LKSALTVIKLMSVSPTGEVNKLECFLLQEFSTKSARLELTQVKHS
jgi:hypothetical protein